ncbi:MAG: hypothetical protein KKC68_01200 [Candidatus Thermoplasmatota archaeon]|nr:hypothetical protein [Candidatus Thermoplasmatota archaeon]MBU1940367.1 hypothetical protein [Candidatus Thermoplasmatota archaeon]
MANKTKKILYIICIFGLICNTGMLIGQPSSMAESLKPSFFGATLFVGGSGPGNYSNISAAYENASDGDTIYVFPGIYTEKNLIINKSLTFIGHNMDTTILDDSNIYFISSSIQFLNFTLDHGSGMYLGEFNQGSDNNKIKHIFFNSTYLGIVLVNSSYNIIENNIFINCGIIIEPLFDYYPTIFFTNTIVNNTVNGKPLVYLEDKNEYTIEDAGQIILIRCSNILVSNITFIGFNPFPQIIDSTYCIFMNCTLINNWILFYNSSKCSIYYCLLDGDSNLMFFINCTDNKIEHSTLNCYMPLFFYNSDNNVIKNNNFLKKYYYTALTFLNYNSKNEYDGNYWYRPRLLPKLIIGFKERGIFSRISRYLVDVDWHPARSLNDGPKPLPGKHNYLQNSLTLNQKIEQISTPYKQF